MKAVLEVRDLVKEFPGVKALQGVNLEVLEGEVHCLLGPNGAGKSTLIKCIWSKSSSGPRCGSCARKMFSATVRSSTRSSSW